MENASKALIIAGAILLSILIIGLGMFIYNQAANALQGTGMDKQKVSAYNGEFLSYDGPQVGTQVRTLCDTVAAHNRSARDASEQIGITYDSKGQEKAKDTMTTEVPEDKVTEVKSAIYQGKRYTVSFVYGPSGEIISVAIADA